MAHHNMKTLLWLSCLAGVLAAPAYGADCGAYASELASMREAAQAQRGPVDYLAPPDDRKAAHRIAALVRVEQANLQRLQALLAECGWPRSGAVGPQASRYAWGVLKQAQDDLDFQKQLLGHLEEAVAGGEEAWPYLAVTMDRVAILEGRPQPYGTQLRSVDACTWDYFPLDDEAKVKERRKAAGLPPLGDFKSQVNVTVITENCPAPPVATPSTPQQ